jgi:hypothetical protein
MLLETVSNIEIASTDGLQVMRLGSFCRWIYGMFRILKFI